MTTCPNEFVQTDFKFCFALPYEALAKYGAAEFFEKFRVPDF